MCFVRRLAFLGLILVVALVIRSSDFQAPTLSPFAPCPVSGAALTAAIASILSNISLVVMKAFIRTSVSKHGMLPNG